jgi:hypothetical protein
MNVIYHKIWSDLWHHKAHTLQVVLIIVIGAFAIGMIVGTRNLTAGGVWGHGHCQLSPHSL